nr:lactonase family protein [Propionibacterium sp.]
MPTSPLVVIANARDNTLSVYALEADELRPLSTTPLPGSCSTFAVDEARDLLYAGVKGDPPLVLTLRLDRADGVLTEVARRPVPAPQTYLTLARDGGLLLGVSYAGDWGGVWPVAEGQLGAPASELRYAHPHCVIATADARHAYVVSLGADVVAQYALAPDGTLTPLDPPTVAAPAGSGPRHLVLDAAERNAYLVTEFSGEVIRLDRDGAGRLTAAEAASIIDPDAGLRPSRLGADPRAEHLVWGADVHLAGGERFVLASERTASTLATLELDAAGRLGAMVALRATEAQPRGFTVTRGGDRVVVVGELATDAALYRVEPDGALTDLHHVDAGRGANWVRVIE